MCRFGYGEERPPSRPVPQRAQLVQPRLLLQLDANLLVRATDVAEVADAARPRARRPRQEAGGDPAVAQAEHLRAAAARLAGERHPPPGESAGARAVVEARLH